MYVYSLIRSGALPVYLRHSLVNDGILAGLTDDQIRPLDDDDRHEEGRVTSELQHLALGIGLFQTAKQTALRSHP